MDKNINIQAGLYIGGMKEEEMAESNKKQVILSTYSMCAEGYDNKEIDTLIMEKKYYTSIVHKSIWTH